MFIRHDGRQINKFYVFNFGLGSSGSNSKTEIISLIRHDTSKYNLRYFLTFPRIYLYFQKALS